MCEHGEGHVISHRSTCIDWFYMPVRQNIHSLLTHHELLEVATFEGSDTGNFHRHDLYFKFDSKIPKILNMIPRFEIRFQRFEIRFQRFVT